jgi:hypothetical protein
MRFTHVDGDQIIRVEEELTRADAKGHRHHAGQRQRGVLEEDAPDVVVPVQTHDRRVICWQGHHNRPIQVITPSTNPYALPGAHSFYTTIMSIITLNSQARGLTVLIVAADIDVHGVGQQVHHPVSKHRQRPMNPDVHQVGGGLSASVNQGVSCSTRLAQARSEPQHRT